MNENESVETALLSSAHPYISKHTNLYSVIVSFICIVAGVGTVLFALDVDNSSSTMSMVLLTVGTILLLFALYRLFWRSKENVYLPTGSSLVEGSCYWDSGDLKVLMKMLEHTTFDSAKRIPAKLSGTVRLDYIISKDRQFAAVQLFHFVPYIYEPASKVYYYTGNDAANLVHYLNTKLK